MTEADRQRWDRRHRGALDAGDRAIDGPDLPAVFADRADVFPRYGLALDLACGRGQAAVWLAQRGLDVVGLDVSPVAVAAARDLAARHGVADRCRFAQIDLDGGLPPGPPVDLVHCHRFRDPRLDRAIVDRLAPGGLLAVAVLSGSGEFRSPPGTLALAFGDLEPLVGGEAEGLEWLLARRPDAVQWLL